MNAIPLRRHLRPVTKLFPVLMACFFLFSAPELRSQEKKLPKEYINRYQEAMTLFQKAAANKNEEDYAKVLEKLDEAEKIEPNIPIASTLRGAVFVQQKHYQKARKIFESIREKDPTDSFPLFNIGETYFLEKNYAQARQKFNEFLLAHPDNDLGTYKVFLCDLLENKTAEVKETLDKIHPNPTSPLYYFIQAANAYKTGKKPEGAGYLNSALQIYNKRVNNAFLDSMIQLGWISEKDAQVNSFINSKTIEPLVNRQAEGPATRISTLRDDTPFSQAEDEKSK